MDAPAKHSIDDDEKVEIAVIDPDCIEALKPVSLMECAMPTTTEVLSAFLRDGHAIRSRLRSEYFQFRTQSGFEIGAFLQPFRSELVAWIQGTEQVLARGFTSRVPSVTFATAPVSALRQEGTNALWGGPGGTPRFEAGRVGRDPPRR